MILKIEHFLFIGWIYSHVLMIYYKCYYKHKFKENNNLSYFSNIRNIKKWLQMFWYILTCFQCNLLHLRM